MFRKTEDFLREWSEECIATERVMRNLTDTSLTQRVTAEGRTLSRIAWHITLSLGELLERIGLTYEPLREEVPTEAEKLADVYAREAERVSDAVPQQWTDDDLVVEVTPYFETWTRGYALSMMIRHQAHHRGQMTVLMRQAGLIVPGVYGPSKEEWALYRIPAAE